MTLEGFYIYRFTLEEYFEAINNITDEDLAKVDNILSTES